MKVIKGLCAAMLRKFQTEGVLLMQGKTLSIGLRAVLAIIAATLFVTSTWAAAQEKVLYSFGNGTDATYPVAGLIFDAAGNLYGTTEHGGAYQCSGGGGCGTVFELSPDGSGGWTATVLHSFGNGTDGIDPNGGVIFDAAGKLYGTTLEGGAYGYGTVFELSPNGGGGWTETVLYSFCSQTNCTDGDAPYAGLIFDPAGNLYGTTLGGGTYNYGAVFEVTPNGTETVLHSFTGTDGVYPYAGLIFDPAGNLYGTTGQGGTYDGGTVFEVTPNGTETVLHNFNNNGTDGAYPYAGLIFDAAGNLYGTTLEGGAYGYGAVFEVTPNGTETVLHNFNNNGTDGYSPYASLIFDAAGNLYGTTNSGGTYNHATVFELTPAAGGGWTETVLHSF